MTKTTDWRDYTLRMIDLLNQGGAPLHQEGSPAIPAPIT
jgi:hypothetical protein